MPLANYDQYFGGKKGAAAKAYAAMVEEYGEKDADRIFYAKINKLKRGTAAAEAVDPTDDDGAIALLLDEDDDEVVPDDVEPDPAGEPGDEPDDDEQPDDGDDEDDDALDDEDLDDEEADDAEDDVDEEPEEEVEGEPAPDPEKLAEAFNPDQPRQPAGGPSGGQWRSTGHRFVRNIVQPRRGARASYIEQLAGWLGYRPTKFQVQAAMAGDIPGFPNINGQVVLGSPSARSARVPSGVAGSGPDHFPGRRASAPPARVFPGLRVTPPPSEPGRRPRRETARQRRRWKIWDDVFAEASDDCKWITYRGNHICITGGHGGHQKGYPKGAGPFKMRGKGDLPKEDALEPGEKGDPSLADQAEFGPSVKGVNMDAIRRDNERDARAREFQAALAKKAVIRAERLEDGHKANLDRAIEAGATHVIASLRKKWVAAKKEAVLARAAFAKEYSEAAWNEDDHKGLGEAAFEDTDVEDDDVLPEDDALQDALQEYGTSEGARKGWETRRSGGGGGGASQLSRTAKKLKTAKNRAAQLRAIRKALQRTRGDVNRAADMLGVDPPQIKNFLKKYSRGVTGEERRHFSRMKNWLGRKPTKEEVSQSIRRERIRQGKGPRGSAMSRARGRGVMTQYGPVPYADIQRARKYGWQEAELDVEIPDDELVLVEGTATLIEARPAGPLRSGRLNRSLNIIEGTVLITANSVNGGKGGRRYSDNALKQIAERAEGLPAYLNHVAPDLAFKPRDVKDLIGVHRNVRYNPTEGRIISDLHIVEHQAPIVFGLAEKLGDHIGNSLVSRGLVQMEGETEVVKEVMAVRSADLVSDPATTKGLFEARGYHGADDEDPFATLIEELREAITHPKEEAMDLAAIMTFLKDKPDQQGLVAEAFGFIPKPAAAQLSEQVTALKTERDAVVTELKEVKIALDGHKAKDALAEKRAKIITAIESHDLGKQFGKVKEAVTDRFKSLLEQSEEAEWPAILDDRFKSLKGVSASSGPTSGPKTIQESDDNGNAPISASVYDRLARALAG